MIQLEAHPEGTVLPVRAQPGARRNELREPRDGALAACVTQAPEKGQANKALLALLAKALGLRRSQIELLSGQSARQKRFLIRDVAPDELRARIAKALDR